MKRIGQEAVTTAFTSDPGSHEFLKQMMALCYAPPNYVDYFIVF